MRCEGCDRQIPDDALLCPYCATGVLRRLESPSPRENSLEGGTLPRQRRYSQRLAIAASFVFLLLSFACCSLALGVNIYYGRTALIGWWMDYRSEDVAPITATPDGTTPVSPVPTPTLVPAEALPEGATAILSAGPILEVLMPRRDAVATVGTVAASPLSHEPWPRRAVLISAG
jgi:hypothetical protein